MKYILSYESPARQYLDIQCIATVNGEKQLSFQLPAWRPGRYELGNFAKNIQKWVAKDEAGKLLNFKKTTKDCWEVDCADAKEVHVFYNYYAVDLNAGSTYLNEAQLYVNPVNCFLYLPSRMDERCGLELTIPNDYEVATALARKSKNSFQAANFDELADSPFIASSSLQKLSFELEGYQFYLWFQGEIKLADAQEKVLNDFKAFTKVQMDFFGEFPCPEYHYYFQILPHPTYHGVEHSNSTVIALGPSYAVFQKTGRYADFLGVSSHELFHTWNIKRIRPKGLFPYDFAKENYSRLGYLAEGATTWYGDEMLYRSGVFDDASYFKTLEQLLDRHFNNPGVLNLSVADSSFDTWLDGYVPGVPNRKSSIYVEGALITLMLDVIIRRNSDDEKSFDDVMRSFYREYYQKGKGITELDYREVVEQHAACDLGDFFTRYINGAEDMKADLQSSFEYLGFQFEQQAAEAFHEARLGFRYLDQKVYSIFPNSPAEEAGLSVGDQIHLLNGYKLNDDLDQWCRYFAEEELLLECSDLHGKSKQVKLKCEKEIYYTKHQVTKLERSA